MIREMLIIRIVVIVIGMISNLLPYSAFVRNSGIYICLFISTIISIIGILCWPNSINEISIITSHFFTGYSLNISLNFIGLYMSFMVDLLTWICLLYSRYYISTGYNLGRQNISSIRTSSSDEMSLMLFYVISVGFFCSNDFISTALLFEFQNVPLLLLLNSRFSQPRNFSIKPYFFNNNWYFPFSGSSIFPIKGIGIASFLLLVYGLFSGILLFFAFNSLFLFTNHSSISKSIDLLFISNDSLPNYVIFSFWLIFLSGGIKLALFPFHVWLGKVHVEAPTIGSVLLAGIALKSGFYLHILFWQFFYHFNSLGSIFFFNYFDFLILFFMFGSLFSSLSLFFQIDIKRWIALFSISHMNLFYFIFFSTLSSNPSFFSFQFISICIIFGMIGHSFISAGLFFLAGYFADFSGSRNFFDISNHLSFYSRFFFFLFLLANSGYPFMVLFICEILSYTQLSHFNLFFSFFGLITSSTCLLSSLFLFSKFFRPSLSLSFSFSFDFFLLFLLFPLLLFSFLFGFQFFSPISFFF